MPSSTITIENRLGLHARAAAKLVQTASHYASEVTILKGTKEVDGKSIMGVMMLAAAQGAEIEIRTEGSDAEEALQALELLVSDRFGESA